MGWRGTRADGFVCFDSMSVRKVVGCDSDAVVPYACGRWAATRAIRGHVSSGTSRPSRASFGRSQIVAHMGLFGLALVVPGLSRPKTAKVVSYDADPVISQACGRCRHPRRRRTNTILRHLRYPRERVGGAYWTVIAVHTGLFGLKSPVATPMPWFTTRAVGEPQPAIGGHVPSGTSSRPSRARVRAGGAKSEIGR